MTEQSSSFTSEMIPSAEEIDDMVSQFRLRTSGRWTSHQQVQKVISDLPRLTEGDLTASGNLDGACPICLNTLVAILAEEEMALAMETPAHPVEELGVTRLHKTCGHLFCRKDIIKWVMEGRDSCPSCRRPFIGGADRLVHRLPPDDTSTGENWLQQRIVDSNMLPRGPNLPAQLPILPNAAIGLGTSMNRHHENEDDRHEYAGMYS